MIAQLRAAFPQIDWFERSPGAFTVRGPLGNGVDLVVFSRWFPPEPIRYAANLVQKPETLVLGSDAWDPVSAVQMLLCRYQKVVNVDLSGRLS